MGNAKCRQNFWRMILTNSNKSLFSMCELHFSEVYILDFHGAIKGTFLPQGHPIFPPPSAKFQVPALTYGIITASQ